MNTQVVILYTHNLRGNLDLLPRLYTFIREIRRGVQLNAPTTLHLDLGDSCSPDMWHCDVTEGRSTLLVLDAMGFHAANARHISSDNRERLMANLMQMALVNEQHVWEKDDVLVACKGDLVGRPYKLQIILTPADSTHLEDNRLHLAALQTGQLGVVHVTLDETVMVAYQAVHTLPAGTLPDPTISAAVEFVLSEARHFRDKKS